MKMTGGQALVQQLKIEGIDTVFALPGVQLDFAVDAFWEERASFALVHTRHEQACSYMADGYARTTGRIGACMVVPGPGLLNAAAGLATAYACNSPVLCVTGQIASDLIGKGVGALHEINNQLETISSVVKHAERAMTPADVPGVVHRAVKAIMTGRPRPAEIEIPPDVLEAVGEVSLVPPENWDRGALHAPDPDRIAAAAKVLGEAERPLVLAGGGVLAAAAWDELREVMGLLEAPVITSRNGRGAVSDRDYHHVAGNRAVYELLPQADAVLVVGTRLDLVRQPALRDGFPKGATVIHLDIDAEEFGRAFTASITVEADAKHGLRALCDAIPKHNRRRESREAELEDLKARIRASLAQAEYQAGYAMALREELPDDGILVSESTQVGYWCHQGGYPVYEPRTYITSGYQGTLGYGFATALGVQVGNPGRKVVSINGDGGFFYNVQELSTMAQQRIPLVTVVFNDNAYGNVRRMQALKYNDHRLLTDFQNPDMVKLADAFGIAGVRAEGFDNFRGALREALHANEPVLIDVPMPPAETLSGAFQFTQEKPRPKVTAPDWAASQAAE